MTENFEQAIEKACSLLNKTFYFAKGLVRGTEKWQDSSKSKSFTRSLSLQKKQAEQAMMQAGLIIVRNIHGGKLTAFNIGIDDLGRQLYQTHEGVMVQKHKQRVVPL